jgi:hypothetical protein
MTPIDPRSISEIIRASAILFIQLMHVQPGPWKEQGPVSSRSVELRIGVKEVLKGQVPVGTVVVTATQKRAIAQMDYLGLWSHVPLDQGTEFVAFCKGASDDAAVLLRDDEGTEQLVPAHPALEDVRAAVSMEDRDAGVADVAREAFAQRSKRGLVYARWVWDRLAPEALRAASGFEPIARLVEDPETAEAARDAYVQAAYVGLAQAPFPVPRQTARLARALFRVLRIPSAARMRSYLEGTVLSNLLHLDGDPGGPTADDVFRGHPEERADAVATVRAQEPSPERDRLLSWVARAAATKDGG